MMFRRERDLVCQQAVELVTDYIEGSCRVLTVADSKLTSPRVRTARRTSPRCGARLRSQGSSTHKSCHRK